MGNFYSEIKNLKKEVTFTKLFITIASVTLFFILPCTIIGNIQKSSNEVNQQNSALNNSPRVNSGKVAGVTTSNTEENIFIPILNKSINLNSQSGLFVIFGLILLAISLILALFLIMDKSRNKKFKY